MNNVFMFLTISILLLFGLPTHSEVIEIPNTPENEAYFEALHANPNSRPKLPPALAKMIFGKSGVPMPNSGVHVVPMSSMHISAQGLQEFKERQKKAKKIGYINEYNGYAITLKNIQQLADDDYKRTALTNDPQSTHLVRTFEELKLSYSGKDLSDAQYKSLIGYSPAGTYMDNDTYKGWTGWGVFFVSKNDLTCTFDEANVEISGGSANVAEENVSKIINNKITTLLTIGNKSSGFVVDIQWFDKTFRRQLRCRTNTYDKSLVESVVAMAKDIDARG